MTELPLYIQWGHSYWPEVDRNAWSEVIEPDEFGLRQAHVDRLRPRTLENYELGWGRFLKFLREHDLLLPVARVGDRLTVEHLRLFAGHLQTVDHLAPRTVLGVFTSVSQAVALMDPGFDRSEIMEIVSRLARTADRRRNFRDRVISPVTMIDLAERMMARAETSKCQRKNSAVLFRDGALIFAAAVCPMRRANWASVDMSSNLDLSLDSPRIRFDAPDMKGNRDEDFPIPHQVAAILNRYIRVFRPRFLWPDKADPGALWLSRSGRPMGGDAMNKKVRTVIMRELGRDFHFHLFRHSAATFISDTVPDQSKMAKGVMRHRYFRTTKQYMHGKQRKAFEIHQDEVNNLILRFLNGNDERQV